MQFEDSFVHMSLAADTREIGFFVEGHEAALWSERAYRTNCALTREHFSDRNAVARFVF